MSPKIVDKEQKARGLAEAALRVFIRSGYHRTKMAEIAEEAGVGKGTLYEYFENKGALFRFVLDGFFDDFYHGILSELEGIDDPKTQLHRILIFSADQLDRWKHVCTIWLDFYSEMRWKDAQGGEEIRRIYETMRTVLSGVIESGQREGSFREDLNPREAASIMVAVFDGLVMQYIFDPDCVSLGTLNDTAEALLTKGVIKP